MKLKALIILVFILIIIYNSFIIGAMTPDNRVILPVDSLILIEIDNYYSKDKNYVYYFGQKVKDADPKSFQIVGALGLYVKDDYHVWSEYTDDVIDSLSITSLPLRYYNYDGNMIVINNLQIIDNADPSSFESIEFSNFARDKNHVWEAGKLIEGIDPATFKYPQNTIRYIPCPPLF